MYHTRRFWRFLIPLAIVGTLFILPHSHNTATKAESGAAFVRGDVDGDRRFLISDAVNVFRYLFQADPSAGACRDAADVDDDGAVTITDGIYLLNYLFQGGERPPPPFPHCGDDPTEDALGCEPIERCVLPEPFVFYDQEFTADCVIFVVDHSGSMNDSGELQVAKTWLSRSLMSLSDRIRFGIIFFDMNVKKFPSSGRPVEARPEMISAALSFIHAIGRGSGACAMKGLREALQFANLAGSENSIILHISDGGGTCGGEGGGEVGYLKMLVAQITAMNVGRVQINCFGIMMTGRTLQENYMKQLAEANGGGYWPIN